jgi:hypothetical protein
MIKKVINLYKIVLILVLMIGFITSSHAQKIESSTEVVAIEKSETQNKMPIKGTYQFIINDTKNQFAFSNETLLLIESRRKENENVKIELGKNVQVIILSKKYVSSKEFIPIVEFVYNQ